MWHEPDNPGVISTSSAVDDVEKDMVPVTRFLRKTSILIGVHSRRRNAFFTGLFTIESVTTKLVVLLNNSHGSEITTRSWKERKSSSGR